MSRVIFMCGPSGAGKSTYARRLESEGMVRLSFDVEMWRRGISTLPPPPDVRDEIETDLRSRLLELVAAGKGVVLDFSFWSRRMRDDYRKLLEPTGVVPETIYLATDRETVLSRMRARRGSHSGASLPGWCSASLEVRPVYWLRSCWDLPWAAPSSSWSRVTCTRGGWTT